MKNAAIKREQRAWGKEQTWYNKKMLFFSPKVNFIYLLGKPTESLISWTAITQITKCAIRY